MSEESVALGPMRLVPHTGTPRYREREDQARLERHTRAAAAADALFQTATAESLADRPAWIHGVMLLMEAIRADYAMVTIVQGEEGRRCRITRGRGLEERPSRGWTSLPQRMSGSGRAPTRVDIETFSRLRSPAPTFGQPVPRAASSFHAPLYASGGEPLGCLSLYSSGDLSLVADRVAFIDAVAARLARELADAPLPAPSAT